MKLISFHCGVSFFFLLFIFAFSHSSALRFLHTKPGENTMKLDEAIDEAPLADLQTTNSFNEVVLGMEECESGDEEECLKRRVLLAVADAHLDYIYTQGHHKP